MLLPEHASGQRALFEHQTLEMCRIGEAEERQWIMPKAEAGCALVNCDLDLT